LYDTKLPVLEYSFTSKDSDLILKYRWAEVDDGFLMPFGIESDKKEGIRLAATSVWQETVLRGVKWFNFYNLWKGYKGCPDNSFTYYNTRLISRDKIN